jgi:putative addiction module component (TIGR02574 family)
MPTTAVYEELREKALQLTPEERIDLAHDLLDSVEPEEDDEASTAVEAAWADEIKSRVDEIRAGTAVTYDAEEVFAELRARFG